METDVRRIDGRLDNGFATNYEMKVATNIGSIAGQHLRLRRTDILKSVNFPCSQELVDLVDEAEDTGRITERANHDLWLLDPIFPGTHREDNQLVYVAAEVSTTVGDDDIKRATERGSALATVISAGIGSKIESRQRQLAEIQRRNHRDKSGQLTELPESAGIQTEPPPVARA